MCNAHNLLRAYSSVSKGIRLPANPGKEAAGPQFTNALRLKRGAQALRSPKGQNKQWYVLINLGVLFLGPIAQLVRASDS